MHYYLAQWRQSTTESGTVFTPDLPGATHWIDLRPDAALLTGYAFVACPARPASDPSTATYLGDHLFPNLAMKVRNTVKNALGLSSLSSTTVPEIVAEVLTTHAAEDGTKWRPIRPYRTKSALGLPVERREIHLGGLIWSREDVL